MYKKLGLGQLKTIRMILLLADRPFRIPRGIVEDVLINGWEFIFSIDMVLEIDSVANPKAQVLLILDQPFLATSNALISCRNYMMKLCF